MIELEKLTPNRWDRYFFAIAAECARMSKDPSTKCGAVIVRPNRTIASTGWNGFPRGVDDGDGRYDDREIKLLMTQHAEANAISSAREALEGYSLYVTPLAPCSSCAGLIIQAGIKTVFFHAPAEIPTRWIFSFTTARVMFEEARVDFGWFGEALR